MCGVLEQFSRAERNPRSDPRAECGEKRTIHTANADDRRTPRTAATPAGGEAAVLQELKTTKSRRTLALPQVCLEALRSHRTKQLAERLKAGGEWKDTSLIFTTVRKARRGADGWRWVASAERASRVAHPAR